MKVKILVSFLLLIMFFSSGCQQNLEKSASLKPNVIIIFSDDQGFGDLSFNQHHYPNPTPNIERIARQGIVFTQGYVPASMCAPSRASLLTGLYPARMGIYQLGLFEKPPLDQKMIQEYFKESGYVTGLIGKWHLGGEFFKEKFPTNRGFDRFYGFLDSTHDYWKANTGRSETYGPCGYAPLFDQEEPVEVMEQYLTRQLTDKALEFIDQNRDKPFFLYLAHHASHVPHQVPRETHELYASMDLGPGSVTTRAMHDELDKGVGEILDRIQDYGISENTIIIFQSDNGGDEPCAKQNWIYRGGKFNLLEGGIRVATVISWPAGLPQDRVYGYPVMNIDFLPTLLAAADIQTDQLFDGVDLLPYLRGENMSRPHEALFWNQRNEFAVRAGDWKLVFSSRGQGLYNLTEDPSEMNDLRIKYPEKAKELKQLYDEWNEKNIEIISSQEDVKYVENIRKNAQDSLKNWNYSPIFGEY